MTNLPRVEQELAKCLQLAVVPELLRRPSGRRLLGAESSLALVNGAEQWLPCDCGREARLKRKEIARASLQS